MRRTCWSTPSGCRTTSTTRRSASSRSTRTRALYAEAHIPGAIGFDWQDGPAGPGQARLPRRPRPSARCSARAGISNDHTIVLYGDRNNWFAAYTYWYLKYYGHDDVKLVNGPREKWIAEGRPTTTDVPRYAAGDVHRQARRRRDPRQARRGPRRARHADRKLVDVRSPQEFSGELIAMPGYEQEGAQRGGHIPGAASCRGRRRSRRTARSSPADELEELYGAKGVLDRRRRSSPTAASASARRTPGSCCTSCSARTTSRTTTARGPSGATSSTCRSRRSLSGSAGAAVTGAEALEQVGEHAGGRAPDERGRPTS